MNYDGCVSSINTTLWTFELDSKITVHMAHMAARKTDQFLPEIGEQVQLFNAHYKASKSYELKKLFLCDQSTIICNYYKTYTREHELLAIVNDYSLGISDLLEIDYNIATIASSITALSHDCTEKIMLEVISTLANANKSNSNNVHSCTNKNIPKFTLKTISSCRYVDSSSNKEIKGPPWSFGSHSKGAKSDILIGYVQINKRYGLVLLYDSKHEMPCLITAKNGSSKRSVLNKFVLIKDYRVFTETYREVDAPNLEYVLFDVEDVLILDVQPLNVIEQQVYVEDLPEDFSYAYDFEFKLLRKASVNIVSKSVIECWLEVLITKNSPSSPSYLALNAYQVRIMPFLEEGETYHVYHTEKLKDWKNFELLRIKSHSTSQKLTERTAVFVHDHNEIDKNQILNVAQAIAKIKETNDCISFQGLLSIKKFTKALSSRTQTDKCTGFGTPGLQTHTLVFVDDAHEQSLLLYLNNWENLQIPLGLIIDMRIYVKNVLPQKNKYLKSCAMTAFEVLGYEPAVLFDTVNLNCDQARACDKYSFLGLGDLLPCNVLIWARTVQLHIRSVKIMYKCSGCNEKLNTKEVCACGAKERFLEVTITLYVYDEMGQAVVISKSLELLRLLLGLEPLQWKVWCCAFEAVGQYTHDFERPKLFSQDSGVNAFCEALALSIKVMNTTKISNLELMCRKMENSTEDNEGMPKWFCVHARKTDS